MKKLAIITTHPIQYNAPWFKLLSEAGQIKVKVFYTWSQTKDIDVYDPGFGKKISWDIPLLSGYDYEFVNNISKNPGSKHYNGIINPTLISQIKSWGADSILVMGWNFNSHLRVLRHFSGKVRILFRGDSTLLDEKAGIKTMVRRVALFSIFRYIDRALYVGSNNKKYFVRHGLTKNKLVWAPHAIDNTRFSVQLPDAALDEKRRSLGIDNNCFVVLFAGKFEPKKNPAYIIELAKRIKCQKIIFLLAGGGVLEHELKLSAANDARIKFTGFHNQSEMPLLYKIANLFILPSTGPGETWGLALNEAMASGLPVAASSKVGGAIDLIDGNGVIFDPTRFDVIIDYINSISSDTLLQDKNSRRSLEIIQQFSFGEIVKGVYKALE